MTSTDDFSIHEPQRGMTEIDALRIARSLTAIKRADYLRAAGALAECPVQRQLAATIEACDETIATLSGMIEARDPNAPKDRDMCVCKTNDGQQLTTKEEATNERCD